MVGKNTGTKLDNNVYIGSIDLDVRLDWCDAHISATNTLCMDAITENGALADDPKVVNICNPMTFEWENNCTNIYVSGQTYDDALYTIDYLYCLYGGIETCMGICHGTNRTNDPITDDCGVECCEGRCRKRWYSRMKADGHLCGWNESSGRNIPKSLKARLLKNSPGPLQDPLGGSKIENSTPTLTAAAVPTYFKPLRTPITSLAAPTSIASTSQTWTQSSFIITIVCSSLGGIVAIVGIFFLYRYMVKRSRARIDAEHAWTEGTPEMKDIPVKQPPNAPPPSRASVENRRSSRRRSTLVDIEEEDDEPPRFEERPRAPTPMAMTRTERASTDSSLFSRPQLPFPYLEENIAPEEDDMAITEIPAAAPVILRELTPCPSNEVAADLVEESADDDDADSDGTSRPTSPFDSPEDDDDDVTIDQVLNDYMSETDNISFKSLSEEESFYHEAASESDEPIPSSDLEDRETPPPPTSALGMYFPSSISSGDSSGSPNKPKGNDNDLSELKK